MANERAKRRYQTGTATYSVRPPVARPANWVPPRLSVAVMAHPAREQMVDALVAKLDRPATVVWDRISDRWDTGRRSQLAFDPHATHHLVVQDDAMIPNDLCAGVERACGYLPAGAAMSLYLGAVRPHSGRISRAVERAGTEVSWIVMRDLHWGVGVVLPTSIIPALIEAQDRRTNIVEYDRRMSRWLSSHGVPVWYTWPSLVSHQHGPSLVAHGDTRHAYQFIGEESSALDVNLAPKLFNPPLDILNLLNYRLRQRDNCRNVAEIFHAIIKKYIVLKPLI